MFKKLYHFLLFIFTFLLFNFSVYAFSPSSSTLYKGIDVSEWQGTIDYSKVKSSGIGVVYIRTGEGSNYVTAQTTSNPNLIYPGEPILLP